MSKHFTAKQAVDILAKLEARSLAALPGTRAITPALPDVGNIQCNLLDVSLDFEISSGETIAHIDMQEHN